MVSVLLSFCSPCALLIFDQTNTSCPNGFLNLFRVPDRRKRLMFKWFRCFFRVFRIPKQEHCSNGLNCFCSTTWACSHDFVAVCFCSILSFFCCGWFLCCCASGPKRQHVQIVSYMCLSFWPKEDFMLEWAQLFVVCFCSNQDVVFNLFHCFSLFLIEQELDVQKGSVLLSCVYGPKQRY